MFVLEICMCRFYRPSPNSFLFCRPGPLKKITFHLPPGPFEKSPVICRPVGKAMSHLPGRVARGPCRPLRHTMCVYLLPFTLHGNAMCHFGFKICLLSEFLILFSLKQKKNNNFLNQFLRGVSPKVREKCEEIWMGSYKFVRDPLPPPPPKKKKEKESLFSRIIMNFGFRFPINYPITIMFFLKWKQPEFYLNDNISYQNIVIQKLLMKHKKFSEALHFFNLYTIFEAL